MKLLKRMISVFLSAVIAFGCLGGLTVNAAAAGKKTIAAAKAKTITAAAKGNNGEGIRFPPEGRLLPGDAHRLR